MAAECQFPSQKIFLLLDIILSLWNERKRWFCSYKISRRDLEGWGSGISRYTEKLDSCIIWSLWSQTLVLCEHFATSLAEAKITPNFLVSCSKRRGRFTRTCSLSCSSDLVWWRLIPSGSLFSIWPVEEMNGMTCSMRWVGSILYCLHWLCESSSLSRKALNWTCGPICLTSLSCKPGYET